VLSGLGKVAGPVGGILSVAGLDGVRNTIKAGKQSRGAAEDDKWRASDLVGGLAYAARQATREGAAKRGKAADQRGDIVDWTLGATSDVVEYAGENKARLGAAGVGTFGFILGTALAGPLGGVAGGVLVSAVTGKTITTLESFGGNAESDAPPIPEHRSDDSPCISVEGEELEIELASHPPPLRGVLAKRRDFFKWDWRTHFFALEGSELKYYLIADRGAIKMKETTHSSQDNRSREESAIYVDDSNGPQKALSLQGLSCEVDEALSKAEQNLYVFTIKEPGKKEPLWVLGAPSESYRTKWIVGLQRGMR
jgi:hypothetical protein